MTGGKDKTILSCSLQAPQPRLHPLLAGISSTAQLGHPDPNSAASGREQGSLPSLDKPTAANLFLAPWQENGPKTVRLPPPMPCCGGR